MTSLLESVTSIVKTLVDGHPPPAFKTDAGLDAKPPINVGEVMDAWKYLVMLEQSGVIEQVGRNTTTDRDLLELLNDGISTCHSQADRLKIFLAEEGIPLPSLPEAKPKSAPESVPLGAKLTDEELANIVAGKLYFAVQECCRSMTEAVRIDVAMMWGDFLYELAKYGAKLKIKMRERGWLKVPPAYRRQGLP